MHFVRRVALAPLGHKGPAPSMSAAVCVRVDDGGTRESTQRPGTDRARATVLTSVHFRRGQTQRRRRRQPDAADGRRAASLPGTDLLPTRPSSPSLTNDPALRQESSLPSCCPGTLLRTRVPGPFDQKSVRVGGRGNPTESSHSSRRLRSAQDGRLSVKRTCLYVRDSICRTNQP